MFGALGAVKQHAACVEHRDHTPQISLRKISGARRDHMLTRRQLQQLHDVICIVSFHMNVEIGG